MAAKKDPNVVRWMKYSAKLSTAGGITTAFMSHEDDESACFDTLSGPSRGTVAASVRAYFREMSPSRACVEARRAGFVAALKRTYGIEPGDCIDLTTLDRQIAEAVRDAGWSVPVGTQALVDAIGEKYELTPTNA